MNTALSKLIACCIPLALTLSSPAQTANPAQQAAVKAQARGVLSVLGSSVAKGWKATGYLDHLTNGSVIKSYAGRLTMAQASNGWRVANQSVPGDTTTRVIDRFYKDEIPVKADEALIGLSLGNEGLPNSPSPQATYNHFFTGITNLIAMCRSNHILPLIGDGYPRDSYTAREYGYLEKMDLQLNTLDAPSVNFLGATDDGSGHWISNAFIKLGEGDGIHPNDAGHHEMFLAIVPSVFEALKEGKPTPHWGNRSRCLRIRGDSRQPAPLSLNVSLMHSFSLSFRVRARGTGTVASITMPGGTAHPTVQVTATGLSYEGINGAVSSSSIAVANGVWHDVVVAHQYARGLTFLYVDGMLIGTLAERLTPVGFVLGGPGRAMKRPTSPAEADYQNWFVHRSLLNAEEVRAQHQGNLQQASLELYAPLDDETFVHGGTATNLAQSLAAAALNGATSNLLSVAASAPLTR